MKTDKLEVQSDGEQRIEGEGRRKKKCMYAGEMRGAQEEEEHA